MSWTIDARWRVGRNVARSVWAMRGDEPSEDDELVGTLDTAEDAAREVDKHNAELPHHPGPPVVARRPPVIPLNGGAPPGPAD